MKNDYKFLNIIVLILLLLSYFLGFLFNENSSGGAKIDFFYHLKTSYEINKYGVREFLLNYSKFENAHSPIFIIILYYTNFFENIYFLRLFWLLISLFAPLIFFKCLKLKFPKGKNLIFCIISSIFFISPYFRSLSYWPGSENLALIFFLLSIFFFLKIDINKKTNNRNYIILNVLFLALASYIRPIYCIFSLFYFYKIIIENFKISRFFIYVFSSLLFSFPAFYYVFILDINFFNILINSNTNFSSKVGLTYLCLFFYLTPFIIFFPNKISLKSIKNLIVGIMIFLIIYYFFKYETSTGGGFYYHLFINYLKKEYFFFILILVAIIFVNSIFDKTDYQPLKKKLLKKVED